MAKKKKSVSTKSVKIAKSAKTDVKSTKTEKKDLSKFKKSLQVLRAQIAGNLEHIEGDNLNKSSREASGDLSGYTFHMADMATDNFDREFSLELASTEQKSLNLIDDALRRIEENKYGNCESCEKPIPMKRLEAVPFAIYCIKCQEIEEKKAKPS